MRDIIEASRSGLQAAQKQQSVTAHNIANINTPGYSRQRTDLSPNAGTINGMSVGRGVNVDDVTRIRHELIDEQIHTQNSQLGGFEEKATALEQVESVFASGVGGDLDESIADFFNSFRQLASNPESSALREDVARKASTMTGKFHEVDSRLNEITESIVSKGQQLLDKVNELLEDLAKLNESIRQAEAKGGEDTEALDRQVAKMEELSKLIDVDTRRAENGTLEVNIGGINLVENDNAKSLTAEADPDSNIFRARLEGSKVVDLKGGQLGAVTELVQQDISSYQEELDSIAGYMVDRVNEEHSQGYNLNDDTGINFFDPDNTTASSIAINDDITEDVRTIAASSAENEPGNNDVAIAISGITDETTASGRSLHESAVGLAARAGAELNEARNGIEATQSAKNMLSNQQESISGVNLDEELTDLISQQNAYQASARVLNNSQQMFDTLLTIV